MVPFKTHHIFTDKLSGSARLVFSMGLEDIERHHEKDFNSLAHAEAYLSDCKRTWLLNCLENFINHKRKIWQNVPNATEQNNACRICFDSCTNFINEPLHKICQRVLKGEKSLEKILPNPNNSSHQSSVKNLETIINFCKYETK